MLSPSNSCAHKNASQQHSATRRYLYNNNAVILYLIIVINICCLHEIECFQRFSEQPKYTEVNPGQDALLTCKVIDKRGSCSWQKDNKPVGIYAKKYEWAARPSSSTTGLHLDLHPPPMQIGGDCSLWIRSATLDFDDGLWECQVTASDFTTQDALTSQPVRLVVRVAPQRPRLEYEGVHVPPGHNITVDSGSVATVKCVSHYGNPPATLKWYLGDQEIDPIHPQTNSTEPDNSRTWSATSVVQVTAMRERHGDILRCVAFHESYTARSVPVEARMDIKYAPTIRLIGSPEIDLEEDKDALILRCVADANPPASIVWRRAGRSEIASLQETLQLRPVGRRDAGLYTCQAQNSVGTSEQLSVQLDVKYPPKIISAGPDRLTTAPLFSPAAFECVADGNPMPSYKWLQRIAHGSKYVERGHESRLVIDNVTYDYQGEYECRATSYINGQERVAMSDPVSLQVVGAPQVLRLHPSMHTISVRRGDPASLTMVVCADPRPQRVAWEWGSLRLEAGSGTVDRFRADDLLSDAREDCYVSTLHIHHTEEHDSRPYYLVVENERGTDRHAVHLIVEEPLEMSYLLGIAGGCLAAVLILICLCIYAIKGKKCCFKGSSGYKSSDKDSEKADLKSRSDSTSGPQNGDSIYTTPAGFHHQQQQQQQQQQQTQQQQLQAHQHAQQQAHLQHAMGGLGGSPEAMKMTTHASATALDDFGNLLWQEEAAEFVEKYPQRRRPLQQSASASTLYTNNNNNSNANIVATHNKRASGGELLTAQHRHQRDLFSGDLGIPEISSHVGSVVHTFETMALQRRLAEQQQWQAAAAAAEQRIEQSKYATPVRVQRTNNKSNTNNNDISNSSINNKYLQLKRKSLETRHKIIQQINQQQQLKQQQQQQQQSNIAHILNIPMQNTTTHQHDFNLQFQNIDEDYRKNLFGTLNNRKPAAETNETTATTQASTTISPNVALEQYNNIDDNVDDDDDDDDGTFIVNAAFDEIFAGYSGIDDDDDNENEYEYDMQADSALKVSPSHSGRTTATTVNTLGRPGLTPKRLPPLTHKKTTAPLPPIRQNKRAIMPLATQKQRSNTLVNFIDRLKAAQAKNTHTLKKIPSEGLIRQQQINILNQKLQKYPGKLDLRPEVVGQEAPTFSTAQQIRQQHDIDFLRGSTLSQSFVRHLKLHKQKQKPKAPPIPSKPPATTVLPKQSRNANVLLFPKRIKSSNEFMLDDLQYQARAQAQARKYFWHSSGKERLIDGASDCYNTLADNAEL